MIKKLRRKFMIVILSIVGVFLAAILTGMFISSAQDWQRRSVNTLNSALNIGKPQPAYLQRIPLLLATATEAGQVWITENHIMGLDDVDALHAVQLALASASDSGKLDGYQLRWMRRDQGGNTRLAFMDITPEVSSLKAQAVNSLLIGIGALAVFFLVSLLLARWLVRPVEQAWEEQRRFVADASHELKTPLTVVLSSIDMLSQHHPEADENSRRWMDNIQAEALRIKKLVGALLDLARYDQEREQLVMSQADFSFLVRRGAMVFEPVIYERGLELSSEIESKLLVKGDEEKLRQLIDILLDNACKYSRPGGLVTVRLRKEEKRFALLAVTNEGEAIPATELNNIFRRFYRLDQSRQAHGGYGWGLSIARSIVETHQGRLWAESSAPGVNSFFVELPLLR